MKTIENDLKYELIDLIYSEGIDNWKESEPDYDIDTCAGTSVEIEPDDAQTIDEVKSFIINSSIMGVRSNTYERKKNE